MAHLPVQSHRDSSYFSLLPHKEHTISYIWLFLQELCPREARDIPEFVLFKLQSPLWLCEVVDYSLKQDQTDAKLYPRVKSTL